MLEKTRPTILRHQHAALNGWRILLKNPLTSLVTIVILAIILMLSLGFSIFADNLKYLIKNEPGGDRILIYLKNISSEEQETFLQKLRTIKGIKQVTLTSPQEGLQALSAQDGMQNLLTDLTDNPLPPRVEVQVYNMNMQQVEALQEQLKAELVVDDVSSNVKWMHRMQSLVSLLAMIANGLMLVFLVVVVLIIGNNLHTSIKNRSEEIQILKLIGAKDSFIIRPFLYSGIIYAGVGAILAVFFIEIFWVTLQMPLQSFVEAYQMQYVFIGLSFQKVGWLLVSTMSLGWLGARLAVRRQLGFMEPYNSRIIN